MFYILNTICSDYALAHILGIIKNIIDVIRIITPIFFIVGSTIAFVKGVLNPENKKTVKLFFNSLAATVITILLPFIINVIMEVISAYGSVGIRENESNVAFQISSCWYNANLESNMDSTNNSTNESISSESER